MKVVVHPQFTLLDKQLSLLMRKPFEQRVEESSCVRLLDESDTQNGDGLFVESKRVFFLDRDFFLVKIEGDKIDERLFDGITIFFLGFDKDRQRHGIEIFHARDQPESLYKLLLQQKFMKHNWSVTLLLVSLFVLAQVIGLTVLSKYIDITKTDEAGVAMWKELPSIAGYGLQRPDVAPRFSVVYILIALLLGTVLILLIIKWQKVLVWKIWFWLAVLLCLHIAFGAFVSSGWAFSLALVLATLKIFRPGVIVHNFTELFIYGGLAVIFVPILTPLTAIVLLALISVYDMYAVWRSQHMAQMAQFQAKSGIFAGLLLPYVPQKIVFKRPARPALVRTAILGGGDIGFPLIFAGVVMKEVGLQQATIISLGAAAALFALLYWGQKKKFYPAMPFLTAGCLVGYALVLLL